MINRMAEIKKKGFAMRVAAEDTSDVYTPVDFSKIKIGAKILDDAILELGPLAKQNKTLADKKGIIEAIEKCDYRKMREISNFFYKTSGIYSRLCRYMAYLYRYDWMITPYINSDNIKDDRVLDNFYKALNAFDNFEIKRFFGEVALKVVRNGCYYGYIVNKGEKISVQELSPNYCRSRFNVNGRPAVEFYMKWFDDTFTDSGQRMKMLEFFPDDFKKGYILYKKGKLPPQFAGDTSGWYLLDVKNTIKFNTNGEDFPAFISVIPAIIDLDAAQELDRKKMAQKLLKIVIQKLPIDKNGDLVFDIDEAQELHNNAVKMLSRAMGIDVLTTFADVDVADMADRNTTTTVDELEKVERTVYNEAGVSQMQFNTDGNIALEKSILNDEAAMYNLLMQFESFLNDLLEPYNTAPKKLQLRAQILTTTIYNYKELAKMYKEQVQLGYSKMLPQIALGQSQSSVLANAFFENDILDLANVFIPPMMSSTMNSDVLARVNNGRKLGKEGGNSDNPEGGRPTNEEQGKPSSEKTIQNKESQS